jgi:hypothetical protein
MILWTLSLDSIFPEVVQKICAMQAPNLEHTVLYYQLVEKGFARRYPIDLARLLLHLLTNATEPFLHCDRVANLVGAIIATPVPRAELTQICEHLARLGCEQAIHLQAEINAH